MVIAALSFFFIYLFLGRKTQEFRLTILRALYDEGGKLDWKVPDPSFEQEMENLNLDS